MKSILSRISSETIAIVCIKKHIWIIYDTVSLLVFYQATTGLSVDMISWFWKHKNMLFFKYYFACFLLLAKSHFVKPIILLKQELFSMEAYRGLHLLWYNLYVMLFIVLSKYKLLCRFIYANILRCTEVSLHNLNHFYVNDQFSCHLLYGLNKIRS